MSNLSENEMTQPETVTPQEIREYILTNLEDTKQVIATLSDEELEEIAGAGQGMSNAWNNVVHYHGKVDAILRTPVSDVLDKVAHYHGKIDAALRTPVIDVFGSKPTINTGDPGPHHVIDIEMNNLPQRPLRRIQSAHF
jgi:hypothetical protein